MIEKLGASARAGRQRISLLVGLTKNPLHEKTNKFYFTFVG